MQAPVRAPLLHCDPSFLCPRPSSALRRRGCPQEDRRVRPQRPLAAEGHPQEAAAAQAAEEDRRHLVVASAGAGVVRCPEALAAVEEEGHRRLAWAGEVESIFPAWAAAVGLRM